MYLHRHISEKGPCLFSDLDPHLECVPQESGQESSHFGTDNDEQTKAGDQCLMNYVEEQKREWAMV